MLPNYHQASNDQVLLDIDERFNYLPKFRRFDILDPKPDPNENFSIVVIDPPFFYIPMSQIRKAVLTVTRGRADVPLLLGFLKRGERELLATFFGDFGIRETKFPLEYATVKANKWKNYALYSNIDLPGIKRQKNRVHSRVPAPEL